LSAAGDGGEAGKDAGDALELFERRSHPRAATRIPVRLVRVSAEGGIADEEETRAEDLGPGGAKVVTRLPLQVEERVWLEELGGGFGAWGEVRSLAPGPDGAVRAGIEFLPEDGPRRSHSRLGARVAVVITRLDEEGRPLESERTSTENVSPGGARVVTRLPIQKGELVSLRESASDFETRARVANTWQAPDGQLRLNLEFEKPLPL
jgi:hypothetical protein